MQLAESSIIPVIVPLETITMTTPEGSTVLAIPPSHYTRRNGEIITILSKEPQEESENVICKIRRSYLPYTGLHVTMGKYHLNGSGYLDKNESEITPLGEGCIGNGKFHILAAPQNIALEKYLEAIIVKED